MKRIILLFTYLLFCTTIIFGQFVTVQYDAEKNYFNEGQPLPSEKPMIFTGKVPAGVNMVEISIFPDKSDHDKKDALHTAIWKKPTDRNDENFSLAVNYKLRASEKYDFKISDFREMSDNEVNELSNRIINQLNTYIDASVLLKKDEIELVKNEKKMMSDMQSLVNDLLSHYRNTSGVAFDGFSQAVRQKLETLDHMDVPNPDKKEGAAQPEQVLATQKEALKDQIAEEVRLYMDKNWSIMRSTAAVNNYETEEKRGYFSVNVGYGAVYLSGPIDNFDYGASTYAGLSFPLSNSRLAPRFLRNAAFTAGVFFKNFEDEDGTTISGLLVDRPIYLGLDYKLFQFVRFNLGAAFLEKRPEDSNSSALLSDKNSDILIRPFIGVSAKIDLSLKLGQ